MDSDFDFYTVAEVAEILRLRQNRVYEAIRQELLPCVHIGRQVRIEKQAFQDWVARGGQTHHDHWKSQAS